MKIRTGNGAAAAARWPKGRSSLALTLISAVLVAGASLMPLSVGGAQAAAEATGAPVSHVSLYSFFADLSRPASAGCVSRWASIRHSRTSISATP